MRRDDRRSCLTDALTGGQHGPFGAQDSGRVISPPAVSDGSMERSIDQSTGEKPGSRRRLAFSSSGEVEEWNSWPGVPPCRRAVVPSCRRAVVPSCRRAVVPSCRRAVVPSCRSRYRLGVGRTATTPTISLGPQPRRGRTPEFEFLGRPLATTLQDSASQTHIIISCFH